MPLIDEAVDLVLEQFVARAQRDLALEVEHDHVAYVSFLDLHGKRSRCMRRELNTPRARGGRAPPARTGLIVICEVGR